MTLEVKVPDIGDFKNVEIIEILIHEGDEIKKNDPLITLESDKSSVEIPSPYDGKISNIKVKVGDKVSQGSVIAIISDGGSEKTLSKIENKNNIPPETEKIINQAEQNLEKNNLNLKNGISQNVSYDNTKSFKRYSNNNGSKNFHDDVDPDETNEWIESLNDVVERDGPRRAHYLIGKLINQAYISGSNIPYNQKTPYINTIPSEMQAKHPGDQNIENKIRSLIRWNAACMVVKANKKSSELGGHIATFASAATLYDVGFNHFWKAQNDKFLGDLIYFQGHSAPGIYARSFLEGRFSAKQLENFRQEVDGNGLSSYPHPWLMPNYWQFPTVSMGLGPIMAIYQARFMKYLQNRGLIEDQNRKVWAFLGDGEMDEPESTGAISLASREKLDNLIFVINCNLQRLDGPVRGNGKIIQELEGVFRGVGWNVIKVIWGSYWDPLITKDKTGLLFKRMEEAVDGEYQAFKAKGGAYVRSHFFGKYPELLELVSNMTDDDIWKLNRGGHDPHKVYAAYHAAVNHKGSPTVIIAKTIKGYGMGKSGESINTTHQQKKLGVEDMFYFRDRFDIPLTDKQVENLEFYRPPESSEEIKYLKERRKQLGGFIPSRRFKNTPLAVPGKEAFESSYTDSGDRELSTTMALVTILTKILRDKNFSARLVPIIPDEARTFGMEGFFQKIGIYAHEGQKYEPVDSEQVTSYREDKKGQVLQEGITEAGAMSSWIAAATSYSNNNVEMVPIYLFYSMFGFQRIGDFAWAAGDAQCRGFLIGATSGRTTLAGEGLQHQDGHSLIMASMIPNCISYDPTYAYEVATIFEDGLKRMHEKQENVFYYITTLNENYKHPAIPKHVKKEEIIKGMYLFREINNKGKTKVQLLGSGAILNEVIKAAEILSKEYQIDSDIWSVTSFNEIKKNALEIERKNLLNIEKKPEKNYIQKCFEKKSGPFIAATDYMRSLSEQIRPYINGTYVTLGTDGFGRSDTRKKLRKFFEVNDEFIIYTTLSTLVREQKIASKIATDAMKKYKIDPEKKIPTKI